MYDGAADALRVENDAADVPGASDFSKFEQ
jgi:hypothetical protein